MFKRKNSSRINMNSFWDFFFSSEERISMYYDMVLMNQQFYM